MKKRILLLLMALSLFAVNVPCYATPVYSESETAHSTVYYTVESSFCVVIPTAIDGGTTFQMTADYINILDSQQVNVYLNGENRVPLTNENGDTMNVMFTADGQESTRLASFSMGQLESGIVVSCQPCFDSTPKAGNYSGIHCSSGIHRKLTLQAEAQGNKGSTPAITSESAFSHKTMVLFCSVQSRELRHHHRYCPDARPLGMMS